MLSTKITNVQTILLYTITPLLAQHLLSLCCHDDIWNHCVLSVHRLIEEVREKAGVTLETDDVYMSTTFGAFIHTMITKSRGGGVVELEYDAVSSS